MLVRVPKSLTTPDVDAKLVQLSGLANVRFHVMFVSRTNDDALASLVDASEESRVNTWLDNHPDTTGLFLTEVDTNQWLTVAGSLPPEHVSIQRPVRNLAGLLAGLLPTPSLAGAKGARTILVDTKTDDLIATGFVVDGKTFSASDAAQLKWLGMYTSRADLSYPVTVPTKDDTQFVSLIDATDVVTYYTALLTRIQTVLSGGVTLKTQIAAASDQAALDAIVDNRT
jgi:hypothetical protein